MEEQQIQQPTSLEEEPIQKEESLWKNKKTIGTAVLIIIFVLLMLTLLMGKRVTNNLFPTSVPTPTPIAPPVNGYQNLTVAMLPEDNSSSNSLFATISATFSRPLTIAERAYTKIFLSPTTPGSLMWSTDNMIATFQPTTHLSANTTYHITLSYGSFKKNWTFSTIAENNVSQSDINNIQVQSDENFGKWQAQLNTNYPWYNDLPLQTSEYYTYFDIDTKEFISNLYVSPSDKGRIQSLKQEITQRLQFLGIDVSKYKLVWNITP